MKFFSHTPKQSNSYEFYDHHGILSVATYGCYCQCKTRSVALKISPARPRPNWSRVTLATRSFDGAAAVVREQSRVCCRRRRRHQRARELFWRGAAFRSTVWRLNLQPRRWRDSRDSKRAVAAAAALRSQKAGSTRKGPAAPGMQMRWPLVRQSIVVVWLICFASSLRVFVRFSLSYCILWFALNHLRIRGKLFLYAYCTEYIVFNIIC